MEPLHVSHVPVDVWRQVFAFIPLYPRVAVVSLICKRWRVAALQSVVSLARFPHMFTSHRLASMLPVISLRSLRLHCSKKMCICDQHLVYTTSLTDMSFDICETSHGVDVLRRNASRLESLSFTAFPFQLPEATALLEFHLPRLSHLSMLSTAEDRHDYFIALLLRHHAQLTSLSLDTVLLAAVLPHISSFPNVTTCVLAGNISTDGTTRHSLV